MAFGNGMVKVESVNNHKEMGGATSKGNFGVNSAFKPGKSTQPPVKSFEAMNDGNRGAAPGIPKVGAHAQQSAPDHGPAGSDHFSRDGKY